MDSWVFSSFYGSQSNIIIIYFAIQVVLGFATKSFFRLVPMSFWHAFVLFLSTSLFSGTTKCSSFIMSCPSTSINCFSKKPWFLSWKVVFRNQDLASGYVHCYWSITSCRPSQHTKLGDISMYIYTYIHIYISISICIYIKPMSLSWFSNSNTVHCSLSIFLIYNFFLREKSVSNDLHWLVCSILTNTYNSYRITNPYPCPNKRIVQ